MVAARDFSVNVAPAPTRKPVEGDWVSGSSATGRSYQGLVEGFTSGGMVKIRTADNRRTMLDPATVEVIPAPGSETVSEVLPILEAIEGGAQEGDQNGSPEDIFSAETGSLTKVEVGDQAVIGAADPGFLSLAQRINALDGQGREAEETALNATRAALDLRRELGQWLAEARTRVEAELGYGQWGKWLGTNCPQLSPRMVSTYMRIHKDWDYIQAHAEDEPLTLRGAIAILQAKNTLSAAPAAEPEPELTFELVQQEFAPWGNFERTKDPKFKYQLCRPDKNHLFRGLREAMQWRVDHCHDWNTLEARKQQQQQLSDAKSCVDCRHYHPISGTQEFECGANGISYGMENQPAPTCRNYNPPLMTVPERVEPVSSETVSEVLADCEDMEGGEAIAPTLQPHSAGVLASSARNAKRAQTEEEAEAELEKDERYTPRYIWEPALTVTGASIFDLDPATNDRLRPHVPCKTAYTILDDGLQQDWSCETLWSNFPYSKIAQFVDKYLLTWENGRFLHGFTLVKSDNSTRWYQKLLRSMTAVCLIDHRLTHEAPGRELNTSFFASALFYHGPDLTGFVERFDGVHGAVLTRAGSGALLGGAE